MAYKLLALDIDGTLLNSRREITPRVRQAIRKAVEAGTMVLLATGRMYRAMRTINESLGLTMPCMVYGGGQIVKDGKIIYECALEPDLTHDVLQWAHETGRHAQVYIGNDFVYEKENEYAREYAEFCGFPGVADPGILERMDIQTPKMLMISEAENVARWKEEAKERYGDRLKIAVSNPRFLELNNPQTSKGAALDFLAKSLGLTADNCIAMGDATLDLPMIEYAGLGVAMENADDWTKSKADFICPSNDEDGVAYVIERFILGGDTL